MKHTPGPWKYLPPQAVGGAAIIPNEGPAITSFWNETPDLRPEDEHRCNAHLIVAAPELVKGAEAMLSILGMGVLSYLDVPGEFWTAAGMLHDAYQKAVGEEES